MFSLINRASCSSARAACAVGWESRLGSHRAQGPGRHQGAAAALTSPKPATTFSGHSCRAKKRTGAESLERERAQGWLSGGRGVTRIGRGEGGGGGGEDLTGAEGASASLLPPQQELPAPTAMWQLRAAFYSCTRTGDKNQYSSAAPAHHLPHPSLPVSPWHRPCSLIPYFHIGCHILS